MFNENDHERIWRNSHRQNVELPKLPPLDTRNPFVEKIESHEQDVSIGWTPVEEQHPRAQHVLDQYSTDLKRRDLPPIPPPRPSRGSVSSARSNSSKKPPSRRPPPPPIPKVVTAPITPSRQQSKTYKSPFVGEADLQRNISQRQDHLYKSPFVGEPVLETGGAYVINNHVDRRRSVETNPFISMIEEEKNRRALPPLPTPRESDPLPNLPEITNLDVLSLQPPTIPGALRDFSNHSRLSDSMGSSYSDGNYAFNGLSARHDSFGSLLGGKPLDQVPSITAPTQPFSIDSLDENKLYQCCSVYRLSDIYEWILKVYFEWFNEYIFGKIEFFQMVQLLLEFQMPKSFDQDTIDSNVDRIIESLVVQKAVRFEQEDQAEITLIIGGLDVSGVFTQLLPCYSFVDTAYAATDTSSCYSYTCVSRLPNERQEIKLSEIINKSVGLWTDYWKLTPEDISEINPQEVQRQSFIFDLIILEERSLNMATAAVEIYGKRFNSSLLPDDPEFAKCAFDIFHPLIKLHKDFLLTPILWKLKTRGKFIDGVGKIYLRWCNEARETYLKYAVDMATVHSVISWEKEHQTRFAEWLKAIDNSPEISRSKMYHDVIFFGGFFKSLQNLPITLNSILKNTQPSSEDYEYLKLVIEAVEKLSADVDRAHGRAIDHQSLTRFSKQLVFRSTGGSNTVGYANVPPSPGAEDALTGQDKLDLGLANTERKILMSGMVTKKRELWLDPTPVFIVLLDNYFLITEPVVKGNQKRYKLAERPIPIDYLNLEEKRKLENAQSSGSSLRESTPRDSTSLMSPMSGIRPNLISAASTVSKSIYNSGTNDRRSNYTGISNASPETTETSFKIRNTATNESFTFIATTLEECQKWKVALLDSFSRSSLVKTGTGFQLQVLSTQFAYVERDAPVNLPVAPEGSEIDVALRHYEQQFGTQLVSLRAMPTTIFCSVSLELEGKLFFFLATEHGVLLRNEAGADQDFVRILQTNGVRKMEVNIKLGLLFVLDNKVLCYFSLSSLIAAYYNGKGHSKMDHLIGVVLSDKVDCFKFADDFGNSRQLLYQRKSRIFLLTPEYDRITKLLKYFKPYKEYKLPTLSTGLSSIEVDDIIIFKRSFIICTPKAAILYHDAFNDEGLTLPNFLNDKGVSSFLKHPHLSSNPFKTAMESSSKKNSSKQKMAEYVKKDIATSKTRPITCFQTAATDEFFIVYDEAVIKIDRHGQIADWKLNILVLDFYCTGAQFYKGYLVLAGDSLVQVYKVTESDVPLSRMVPRQIIKGKKVKLINSDKTGEPIVALSHPNIANRQLLMALRPQEQTIL